MENFRWLKMSYGILYQRFLVKDNNNNLIPYIIQGSNNCFEMSGKRERNLTNLFKLFNELDKSDLYTFLKNVYKEISDENSGYIKGISKTEKGFIDGFYKKIVNESDLLTNGEYMEDRLKLLFKSTKKQKSVWDIAKENENQELKKIDFDSLPKNNILFFNKYKQLCGKGKIKKTNNGDYGFFKSKSRRYYQPLNTSNEYYYKTY